MITAEQLIEKVRELAAAKPDFVYRRPENSTSCLYREHDGMPGCIFGQAFDALGVELTDAHEHKGITRVLSLLGISVTRLQVEWMMSVQDAQDLGHSWAEAIARADFRRPLTLTNY